MAFTKTPSSDTYTTKMVSLLKEQHNRGTDSNKDTDFLNCYVELTKNRATGEDDFNIVKRSGCANYVDAVAGTTIRGMHYNEDFRKLYYVVGNTLYVWSVTSNLLVTSIPAFFGTTSGDIGFCDYLYDTGTAVVIITDGTTLKSISSTEVVVTCADADMPVHQPAVVFLDGYIFIVKINTGDIYNSDLNNPMAWTPGNFITAEIAADDIKKLVKLNNYLVVFGSGSIEYFWDAGNATGSPLQRNDTPVKLNGYLGGVAQWGNNIYFIGNNKEGQPDVFMLEDLKMEAVGTTSVNRYLQSLQVAWTNIKASIVGIDGHHFYVMNAGETTYVYDITSKLWVRWAFKNNANFKMLFCINTKISNDLKPLFAVAGVTNIYQFDSSYFQDDGVNYTMSGVTANQNFDTMNQKFMHRLTVWADKAPFDSFLVIQWSDDDYQTWSTVRNIQLNSEMPSINQLGRFRRRAFKWSLTSNQPMRIKAIEVDLNMGQT